MNPAAGPYSVAMELNMLLMNVNEDRSSQCHTAVRTATDRVA